MTPLVPACVHTVIFVRVERKTVTQAARSAPSHGPNPALRLTVVPPDAPAVSGPDLDGSPTVPVRFSLLASAWMSLAIWAAFTVLAFTLPGGALGTGFDTLSDLLTTGSAILAVVLGVLRLAQGRVAGANPSAPWTGVALVLYGAVVLQLGRVYPVGGSAGPEVLGYLSAGTLVVVVGLLVWSLAGPMPRLAPIPAAGAVTVVVLALSAALQFWPDFAEVLVMAVTPHPATANGAPGQLVMAAVFGGLAIVALGLGIGPIRSSGDAVVGVVALGLAQARLALGLAPGAASSWVTASHLFQLAALAVGLGLVSAEFSRRASRQRNQLFDSFVAARADGARRQARQTIESGRRHDLRSALFVLDGAARTLAEKSAQLSDADRRALGRMLTTGVEQLGELVDLRIEGTADLALDTLCRSLVHAEQRAGAQVTTAVPDGLRAVGRPDDLGVVLRTLLRTMRPQQPLVVRGEHHGATVALIVQPASVAAGPATTDWAPVVPTALAVGDDALDLYIATRLLAEQGADLLIASHRGGLVSFAVRLPAAGTPPLR